MSSVTREWIPVAEAAELLKCSARTVLRLAEQGVLERVQVNPRMYLVKRADVVKESKRPQTFGRPRGS